jgi:hypothetical protein
MQKFFALTIFVLVSLPARAETFDMMAYGPPDRYLRAFAQCAASTATAAQELECARQYVLHHPVPAVETAAMMTLFERGRAIVEATRAGFIADAEARAQLAENMAEFGVIMTGYPAVPPCSSHYFMPIGDLLQWILTANAPGHDCLQYLPR